MTLKELVELYVLQKDYHESETDYESQFEFQSRFEEILIKFNITVQDEFAPGLYEGQPDIPFVLFAPKELNSETRLPLLIHTHGGPNVYMDKKKAHAEIAYYVSHGYVVACPNYRGSTSHPFFDERDGWKKWEKNAKDKHHIYGAEDVYAVAKCMTEQTFIDSSRISLRGGSFGSFINSHLLAAIKEGKFENIFIAAHFSGGVKYPPVSALPDDIALMISHGMHDPVAPFEDARLFMEKCLLRELTCEIEGERGQVVQTFIAECGNHHLINPKLKIDAVDSISYREIESYLAISTNFINGVNGKTQFSVEETYDQYKRVLGLRLNADVSVEEEIIRRVRSFKLLNETADINDFSLVVHRGNGAVVSEVEKDFGVMRNNSPTMSLLKLYLGDEFSGDVKNDLKRFLSHYFVPVKWDLYQSNIHDAGEKMLADVEFVDQLVDMVNEEQAFLSAHPDYFVMYHAAENNVLQLYTFINLWKQLLMGASINMPPDIATLRLYDFIKESFENIETFLINMRKRKDSKKIFNNVNGFSDRAISANPTLISNAHSTASCSLWWYFQSKSNNRLDASEIIKGFLNLLGINSPERVARYVQFFKREQNTLDQQTVYQGLMQQLFVPFDIVNQKAYLCQLWGEEFKDDFDFSNLEFNDISKPEFINNLMTDPVKFEKVLRKNRKIFSNPGRCLAFWGEGFKCASVLQVRYLPSNSPRVRKKSYYRNAEAQKSFSERLLQLIKEDFADFLANEYQILDVTIQGASEHKKTYQSYLRFHQTRERFSLGIFFLQQKELYHGLVQNPYPRIYGHIIRLDKKSKTQVQYRLRKVFGKQTDNNVFLFSLCRYLKGYTYYDLIREAAVAVYQSVKDERSQQSFEKLMKVVEEFSIPDAMDSADINSNSYYQLRVMLLNLKIHTRDPKKHRFMQPLNEDYAEEWLWQNELGEAVDTVLRYARIAKEQMNGQDVKSKKVALL